MDYDRLPLLKRFCVPDIGTLQADYAATCPYETHTLSIPKLIIDIDSLMDYEGVKYKHE